MVRRKHLQTDPRHFQPYVVRLLEDAATDDIRRDARHWLTIGGYCSEAQLIDPFLGAVKLMRATTSPSSTGYMTSATTGEWIWNFAFYPAAMTVIQHEMLARYPFMKDGVPVAYAATSSSIDQAPAYAWKLPTGRWSARRATGSSNRSRRRSPSIARCWG